jgi:hypothetical protein
LASLGVGFLSAKGEPSQLMSLLSSIVGKQRTGERNPKQEEDKVMECEMVLAENKGGIYSLGSVTPL